MDDVEKEALIKLFLEHGADVNAKSRSGETVLCEAVKLATLGHASPDIVKLLLDAGADPSIVDSHGSAAADLAQADPKIEELFAKHAAAGGDA